jgi:predicted molibdopterin-dependent oxidoreductase YjgC
MHIILREGWQAQDYIEARTENFEELKKTVMNYPPEKVAEITGVAVQDLRAIAEAYAKSASSSIVYAMGITQHTTGVDNVKSLASLAMLCGKVGFDQWKPIARQNNGQGPEVGRCQCLFGYQRVDDEEIVKSLKKRKDRHENRVLPLWI